MGTYVGHYNEWLEHFKDDPEMTEEIVNMSEDEKEEAFSEYLTFGTGGLRAKMRPGIRSLNVYTIAHVTQALANVLKTVDNKNGVVIAHDSRNNGELFTETAASVLAANGFRVYVFDELRPTPELSFTVRYMDLTGGINITASHNPKEYNGYKVFWSDGAQLGKAQADAVQDEMLKIDIFKDVLTCDYKTALEEGKISVIGKDFDEHYIEAVLKESVDPDCIRSAGDLAVVYTPLAGTGYRLVPEVLRRAGVARLYTVAEQMTPDGNFTTTPKPNPEYMESFDLGIKLAEREDVKSDLIIATDPDADRTGVAVRSGDGFRCLSGNQVGALLLDYIIEAYKQSPSGLPDGAYAVKTIVSTELASEICRQNGVKLYNLLTGFKYIGEVVNENDARGNHGFLLGFEESYGYLKGNYARDKDGVVATMLICEMAAYYKQKNMTLYDAICAIYEKYGYYREKTTEKYFEGAQGPAIMSAMMDKLRSGINEIGGEKIVRIKDYLNKTDADLLTGKVTETDLPVSNVLYFVSEKGNITIIRPSGTEPKIKLYFLAHGENAGEAEAVIDKCYAEILSRLNDR